MKSGTKLSIFDTFKTTEELTGEARRQRAIITILASNANPAERTRTGISQKIAKVHGIAWKNIYSGIFRDLDEVLIPLEIAEEHGRLPLKRGPKALQEKGIPYYHLTKKGLLVSLSIDESHNPNILEEFFKQCDNQEKEYEKIITNLSHNCPNFTHSVFQKYVKAFCDAKIKELLPFELSKLKETYDKDLLLHKEILQVFSKLSKEDKEDSLGFLSKIA